MADGQYVSRKGQGPLNGAAFNYDLLDDATTTTNSVWVPVGNFRQITLEADGIVSGDIVTLYGALDDGNGIPANTAHRQAFTTTLTADGIYELTARIDFLKARLTDHSGDGTVRVTAKVSY
jgi:hypothetical protein